ncbi:crossover junction endodeoxyribonuclease RuvC [Brooklawnia sp.]|uniref:crossover junction endodeoxyribonuclease RuvC n=1 Tax=Brooklawnia sp. TaxID=2699740 RepID=UPI00311D3A03
MRVLGVDPGLTRCGVGVIDAASVRSPQLVAAGVVRTSPGLDHAHRLLAIEEGLEAWVQANRPEVIAVERVFAQHNVMTVTGTAQAAGIAMLIAARHAIPVALHTPTEVKAAITGSGRADKAQVAAMVVRILKLDEAPRPADAADAVALALCQLWRGGSVNRYAAAVQEHAARTGRR